MGENKGALSWDQIRSVGKGKGQIALRGGNFAAVSWSRRQFIAFALDLTRLPEAHQLSLLCSHCRFR